MPELLKLRKTLMKSVKCDEIVQNLQNTSPRDGSVMQDLRGIRKYYDNQHNVPMHNMKKPFEKRENCDAWF